MTNRFEVSNTPLAGLTLLKRFALEDNRGLFQRVFDLQDLQALGWEGDLKQVNHTKTTRKGSLRGMHLQLPPFAEYKLVSCFRGSVFDVVVDLRRASPTFLQTYSVTLAADALTALLIPPGFAHGFQTLEDDVEMLYCHSQLHHPKCDWVTQALDARLGITWPLVVTERSERDRQAQTLDQQFEGIAL